MRYAAGEWTELQRAFIAALAEPSEDGKVRSMVEAARIAGYASPESEVDGLMEHKHVRQAAWRAMHRLAKERVQWRELIDESMRVLSVAMRTGDPKLAVTAAGKVLDIAIRLGEESLTQKAVKEDILSASRSQLAEAYLGQLAKAAEAPEPAEVIDPPPVMLLLNPSRESEH